MLLANADPEYRKIDPRPEGFNVSSPNILDCSLYDVRIILKFNENQCIRFLDVANSHWFIGKKNHVSKGFNGTSRKCSRLFFVPQVLHILNISWNPFMRFSVMFLQTNKHSTHTNKQTNQRKWKHNLRRPAKIIIRKPYTTLMVYRTLCNYRFYFKPHQCTDILSSALRCRNIHGFLRSDQFLVSHKYETGT